MSYVASERGGVLCVLFFNVSLPAVPRLSSSVISSVEGNQIANALGHELH